MTPAVLAVLALLLAGPAPWLLGRWRGLRLTPRPAMVLWQAVALAAVLSALGAGLSLVTDRWLGGGDPVSAVTAVVALVATLTVLGRLLLSGHRVGTRLRRLRRRHRTLVDLLAAESSDRDGLRVLHDAVPLAYCLPGVIGSRVVLTDAALQRFDAAELAAVMAHERAHLRARHDLVLEGFTVLQQAFPAVITGRRALAEVRLLVEVLADRAARLRCGTESLVRALSQLVDAQAPDSALGVGGQLAARLEVLLDERPRRLQAVTVYAVAVALLMVPTVLVVAPWIGSLRG